MTHMCAIDSRSFDGKRRTRRLTMAMRLHVEHCTISLSNKKLPHRKRKVQKREKKTNEQLEQFHDLCWNRFQFRLFHFTWMWLSLFVRMGINRFVFFADGHENSVFFFCVADKLILPKEYLVDFVAAWFQQHRSLRRQQCNKNNRKMTLKMCVNTFEYNALDCVPENDPQTTICLWFSFIFLLQFLFLFSRGSMPALSRTLKNRNCSLSKTKTQHVPCSENWLKNSTMNISSPMDVIWAWVGYVQWIKRRQNMQCKASKRWKSRTYVHRVTLRQLDAQAKWKSYERKPFRCFYCAFKCFSHCFTH